MSKPGRKKGMLLSRCSLLVKTNIRVASRPVSRREMAAAWGEIGMKAIVWTKYGSPDGLQLRAVEKPAFGDNDLLIRVHATTVTAGDTEVRSLKFPLWLALPIRLYMGVIRPRNKILGPLAGSKNATHTWRCTRFLVLSNQWRNERIKRRDSNL